MSYQVQSPPAKGPRRTGLLVLGVILLIGGVGAGAALYVNAGSQYDEAVKNLQRAPVGCDTEFEFTGTGTFIFYIETTGSIGELRGDCENAESEYDRSGEERPRVDLELVDEDGDPVDLERFSDASYDTAGFVGEATRRLVLEEPGTFVLSVLSDDDDFAISVGRNPKSDYESAQTTALIVAGAGLVLGLLFIILGLRRKPAPTAPGTGYSPVDTFPATGAPAPAGPVYGTAPVSPPQYAPPPGQPPAYTPPPAQGAPPPPPWTSQ